MPDYFRQVWAQRVNSDSDSSDTWSATYSNYSAACFRVIVNDHFADGDYIILSEASDETQAVLPPRIKTMEVVGDDLELSYDDAIYLATGWYPKDERCMGLSARFSRAGLMAPRLIETPSSGALSIAGLFDRDWETNRSPSK